MRYFERFLAENESGYDDIDISVHCDVEIFEWLMSYIHEPDKPPVLDKAIVVSILISSEFLQMDSLVELCLENIATNLGDIIRLPIDLSCISDKLVNRLAALTQPKMLAQTKDRKDKILNKLYKRRVELDFSRKSGSRGGTRTIAASLTCCRYCGCVYLDNCVSMLSCRSSPPAIDFRGRLARRHSAIIGWSLTAYLKTLHAGGMSWDAIYWHVWAACEVFRVADVMIDALEVDRYTIEPDGLLIRARVAIRDDHLVEAPLAVGTTLPPKVSSSYSSFQAPHTSNRAPIEKAGDILNDSDQVLNATALSAYLSSLGVFCADDLEFINSDNLEILSRDHLKVVGGKKLKKALNTLIA
jgi:hypothetical protein